VQRPQCLRSARSHSGDAGAAQIAQILEALEEIAKESVNAVGARENKPVVRIEFEKSVHEALPIRRRLHLYRGDGEDFRAQVQKALCQRAGLFCGTGDDDPPLPEQALFEPVEFLPQADHVADHSHRWRADALLSDNICDGGEGARDRLLAGGGAPSDDRDGRSGWHAVLHESCGDLADAFCAHHDHLGAGSGGHVRPVDGCGARFRVRVSGDERDSRGHVAVR